MQVLYELKCLYLTFCNIEIMFLRVTHVVHTLSKLICLSPVMSSCVFTVLRSLMFFVVFNNFSILNDWGIYQLRIIQIVCKSNSLIILLLLDDALFISVYVVAFACFPSFNSNEHLSVWSLARIALQYLLLHKCFHLFCNNTINEIEG